MDAAHEVAQVSRGPFGLLVRAVDDGLGRGGIGPQPGPGQAEVEREVYQLRLEPVVQVAFNTPPFRFR